MMMVIGQPAQVLMPTKIGESVKFLVGIVKPFRTHIKNWMDPNIQPIIVHLNQATCLGHFDWDYSPLRILDSCNDVSRSRRNIDNRTLINQQGPIVCCSCLTSLVLKTNSRYRLRKVILLYVYRMVIFTLYYDPTYPPWYVVVNGIYPTDCSIVTTIKGVCI